MSSEGGHSPANGRLVLAATPLGDVGDASARLVAAIAGADVIAAEDTRRFLTLAGALNVKPTGKVVSFYEVVETARLPKLLESLRAGQTVMLVPAAGMPRGPAP